MRTLSLFLLFITLRTLVSGQVVVDGKKFDCGSATTNYELGICSKYELDQSIKEYRNTLKQIYKCLDTLIAEDKRERINILKSKPDEKFERWTDYSKIKKILFESSKLFEKHAGLERELEGEFYGLGRERTVGENEREKQLYDIRTKELKYILKMHCN